MRKQLEACRALMQQVEKNRNAVVENEKETKRNKIFFDAYQEFSQVVHSFLVVKTFFDFSPSQSPIISMQNVMNETQKVFQLQKVINPNRYKEQVQKCCGLFKQEWEIFSKDYAKEIRESLEIVKMLSVQKGDISGMIRKLKACQTFPVTFETAQNCVNARKEAESLLAQMHFDAHISEFLNKVKLNSATLLDLTPEVKTWLEDENMLGKIFLKIQM